MPHKRFFNALNSITRRMDAARRRELSKEWTFRDGLNLEIAGRGGLGAFALTPLGAAGNCRVEIENNSKN